MSQVKWAINWVLIWRNLF